MAKMHKLLASMLKVGIIGFGGGNALIPVIQQEVVKEKKLITKEEYEFRRKENAYKRAMAK